MFSADFGNASLSVLSIFQLESSFIGGCKYSHKTVQTVSTHLEVGKYVGSVSSHKNTNYYKENNFSFLINLNFKSSE
jgi:hypothetical protein